VSIEGKHYRFFGVISSICAFTPSWTIACSIASASGFVLGGQYSAPMRLVEDADDVGCGRLVDHRLAFALCLVSCGETDMVPLF
jgi:hypothetical protein